MAGYRLVADSVRTFQHKVMDCSCLCLEKLSEYIPLAIKLATQGIVYVVLNFKKICFITARAIARFFIKIYKGIVQTIKDVLSATNPEDE